MGFTKDSRTSHRQGLRDLEATWHEFWVVRWLWQLPWQNISELYDHFNFQSRGFAISRNMAVILFGLIVYIYNNNLISIMWKSCSLWFLSTSTTALYGNPRSSLLSAVAVTPVSWILHGHIGMVVTYMFKGPVIEHHIYYPLLLVAMCSDFLSNRFAQSGDLFIFR